MGFWPKLQVCHWVDPKGSTHGSQKFRKIDEQFLKNLKLWKKDICLMINYENDNFELLSPREMMRIEFKEFFDNDSLESERYLSRWIKNS